MITNTTQQDTKPLTSDKVINSTDSKENAKQIKEMVDQSTDLITKTNE